MMKLGEYGPGVRAAGRRQSALTLAAEPAESFLDNKRPRSGQIFTVRDLLHDQFNGASIVGVYFQALCTKRAWTQ